MPSLADVKGSGIVKMLYIGDSGTGKTGSLESLVRAGYKLRILDYDAGVGVLKSYVLKHCPDKINNVEVITLRDALTIGNSARYGGKRGPIVKDNAPKAFTQGLEFMEKWDDGSNPATWGPEYILILDSLTAYGRACYDWAFSLNPSAKDPRQWYFSAQQGVENVLALLTSEAFNTNVVIISHINWKEITEGVTKGHASSIGTAQGPSLPRYFNTLVMAESEGTGKAVKRLIRTMPTGLVDLKTPVSHSAEASYPLESGLATLFDLIRKAT